MEESLIPVNVVVGDRTYRIRIEPRARGDRKGNSKDDQRQAAGVQNHFCRQGYAGLYRHGGTYGMRPQPRRKATELLKGRLSN